MKVLVLGSSGSGKSTLAKRLGEYLAIEVIHLDSYYWQPNWVEPSQEKWMEQLKTLLQKNTWVMDGNYIDSLDIRIKYADSVIFIDFNRFVCLWRCLKRFSQYKGSNRQELAVGCNEKIDWEFIKWIWNYPRDIKPKILKILDTQPDKKIFRFKSYSEIQEFFEKLYKVKGHSK